MKEFLWRPEAYIFGRDCRPLAPTSPAQRPAERQPSQVSSASTGVPVTGCVWPAVTPPTGQLRAPWLTPAPRRGTVPPGWAEGNRRYQEKVLGQSRRQQQLARDAGNRYAGAGVRPATGDDSGLNLSMNRATTDDRPSSSSVDVKQPSMTASATRCLSSVSDSAPTVAQHADDQTTTANDYDERLPTWPDGQSHVATDRRNERVTAARSMAMTSGPLTSTPVDHNAPAANK